MDAGETLGLSDGRMQLLVRAQQVALAGLVAFGLLAFELGVALPAGIALGVTFLPALLRREYGYSMDVGLVLWITVSVFLHTVGTIGVYERYQWYDEVTHTVSATLIAGIGYATFQAVALHTDEIDVPETFRAVFIVVFVLAAAVVWEIAEFALGGYVTVYGIDDIVTDMIANAIGAVLVAIAGSGPVDGLVGFLRARLRSEDA